VRDGWLETDTDERTELYMVWGVAANDYGKFTKYQFGTPECEMGTCGKVVFDGIVIIITLATALLTDV
jgi:hypothetical protein